jgi:hypothetical protein
MISQQPLGNTTTSDPPIPVQKDEEPAVVVGNEKEEAKKATVGNGKDEVDMISQQTLGNPTTSDPQIPVQKDEEPQIPVSTNATFQNDIKAAVGNENDKKGGVHNETEPDMISQQTVGNPTSSVPPIPFPGWGHAQLMDLFQQHMQSNGWDNAPMMNAFVEHRKAMLSSSGEHIPVAGVKRRTDEIGFTHIGKKKNLIPTVVKKGKPPTRMDQNLKEMTGNPFP